ncbi:hypothetical protein [Cellulosimicrobium sp. Marseille-Q8652]
MTHHDTAVPSPDPSSSAGPHPRADRRRGTAPRTVRPTWASALSSGWPLAVGLVVAATAHGRPGAQTSLLGEPPRCPR